MRTKKKCKKCGERLGYENGEMTVCINKDCELEMEYQEGVD